MLLAVVLNLKSRLGTKVLGVSALSMLAVMLITCYNDFYFLDKPEVTRGSRRNLSPCIEVHFLDLHEWRTDGSHL